MKNKVMIVDDEPQIREVVGDILEDEGYEIIFSADGVEAEKKIMIEDLDAVILDVLLPKKGGLDLLDNIHKNYPLLPVIIMSGHGNIKMAVDAMQKGAYDFIEKPLSMERIISSVRNAIRIKELQAENIQLKSRLDKPIVFIGESQIIKSILDQLPNIAQSDASVLITGENGTGKEIIARLIHLYSKRKSYSFVGVNCAAIPENLIESELFGYEKGAFTGANQQKKGKFEVAHKGTIFLDEIGDLSLTAQAKVLRVLQEKQIERLGGNKIINVDSRLLAATNKNLDAEIEDGNFRQDLFYRLNVIPLHIPALREHKQDIPLLIDYFLKDICNKSSKNIRINDSAIELLMNKSWPGNVRELQNFVERLVILSTGDIIDDKSVLKFTISEKVRIDSKYDNKSLKDSKKIFEKGLILDRLMKNNMNITHTAETLEIERTYLHKKMKELGIDAELDMK